MPYSSEVEWTLFYDNSSLLDEKGQYFDFVIKPKAVIMGRNRDFRKRVKEYVSKNSIQLLQAQDIIV